MSKLCESRESNLINPLTKDEAGYLFDCTIIDCIIDDINKSKYGAYLIGGCVGTGKSSVVDIAASFSKDTPVIVKIRFYNEDECVENFSRIVMESLLEELEKNAADLSDTLQKLLKKCKLELYYRIDEGIKKEERYEELNSQKKEDKLNIFSRIGAAINMFFSAETGIEVNRTYEENDFMENGNIIEKNVSMTKIERDRIADIIKIIKELNNQKVIFVYDELDKMNINVLKLLFAKYKNLFVQEKMFNFFLVNDEMFLIYGEDTLSNSLYTYFSGKYYIPLLGYRDTIRYCLMMFGEQDYLTCMSLYYKSLGNYRILNSCYNSNMRRNNMEIIKSFILIKVRHKIEVPYLSSCLLDILIKKIKLVIEKMFEIRNFSKEDFAIYLNEGYRDNNVWPRYEDIIDLIVDTIEEMVPEAVQKTNNYVLVNGTKIYDKYLDIEQQALSYRRESLEEDEIEDVQLSDMYSFVRKNLGGYYKHIAYLRENIIPVEVARNEPGSYREILINLLKSNLYEKNMQVIILKMERGEKSIYQNDHAYTGIIVVDKG